MDSRLAFASGLTQSASQSGNPTSGPSTLIHQRPFYSDSPTALLLCRALIRVKCL